jgi:transposase
MEVVCLGRNKESSYVDENVVKSAEKDLEFLPNGVVAIRLLAIIAAGRGLKLEEIAEFLKTTRQSVAKWIAKYRTGGLGELRDKPKGHRIKRISPAQEQQMQDWIERGVSPSGKPYHWTIDKIKTAIEEQFNVALSRSRVGCLVQEWGFRPKVPRPKHLESDKEAQEAFKKTLRAGKRTQKNR